MPATDYTDGKILADSFQATIKGLAFIVNNCSLTAPIIEATRTDEKGAVVAWRGVLDDGNVTGTAELQIDEGAKVQDLRFAVVEIPADANPLGEEINCIITGVTSNVTINQSRTISVNIRKLINAPVVPPPPEPEE